MRDAPGLAITHYTGGGGGGGGPKNSRHLLVEGETLLDSLAEADLVSYAVPTRHGKGSGDTSWLYNCDGDAHVMVTRT